MKTERLTIYKKIGANAFSTDCEPPHTIDYAIKWLAEMKEKGANVLAWEVDKNDWGEIDEVKCTAFASEKESSEQYKARIKKEKDQADTYRKNQEMTQRAEYQRLKKLYGDK